MRAKHAKLVASTSLQAAVAATVSAPKVSFTAATTYGLKSTGPAPLTSSSAAFSGSIMERNIEEKVPAKPVLSPVGAVPRQTPAFTAPRNRFINEKSEDALTMQAVGEPVCFVCKTVAIMWILIIDLIHLQQPVKRVSRFKAARENAS